MSGTYGRECQLGWGWNEDLNLLIPVQGKPPGVASQVKNTWNYSNWPSTMSSTHIECSVSFLFAR